MEKSYSVVTGASSGIGAAISTAMAKNNQNVIMIARRTDNLITLKNKLNNLYPDVNIVIVTQDLSKIDELENLYNRLNDSYKLDTWINNAGFDKAGEFDNLDIKTVTSMIRTDSEAVAVLSNLFVHDHKDEKTKLLNIGSLVGYTLWPGDVLYSSAKHFVTALTEGLSREMQTQNSRIQVKLLSPRQTRTDFIQLATGKPYDFDNEPAGFNTSDEMASFAMKLLNSDSTVGFVNDKFKLELLDRKMQ